MTIASRKSVCPTSRPVSYLIQTCVPRRARTFTPHVGECLSGSLVFIQPFPVLFHAGASARGCSPRQRRFKGHEETLQIFAGGAVAALLNARRVRADDGN